MPEDLVAQLVNHPLFWVVLMGIIIYFIIKEMNKGKLKPEQQPDFGVKYRAWRVKEHLNKRAEHIGEAPSKKTILYYGFRSLGVVKNIDIANVTELERVKDKKQVPKVIGTFPISIITYRRFGFWNWLLANIGMNKRKLLIDQDTLSEGEEKLKGKRYMTLCIPDNVILRERGGVLFVSKNVIRTFIDDINSDKDFENTKGFVSDFPRRLSNLHPAHAAGSDKLELQSELEEKKEEKKRRAWGN